MKKPFIVANVREITDLLDKGEISYSRMVEMLNEIAEKFAEQEKAKTVTVHYINQDTESYSMLMFFLDRWNYNYEVF